MLSNQRSKRGTSDGRMRMKKRDRVATGADEAVWLRRISKTGEKQTGRGEEKRRWKATGRDGRTMT